MLKERPPVCCERLSLQDKLVNFMAPKRAEESAIASQLFKNLFSRSRIA